MRHGKFSSSNELFKLLQKEYIKIVDEIAGECVTDKRLYDKVIALVNEANVPPAAAAAAVPEQDLMTSDTESDQESATLHEGDADMSDGDKKGLLQQQLLTKKERNAMQKYQMATKSQLQRQQLPRQQLLRKKGRRQSQMQQKPWHP